MEEFNLNINDYIIIKQYPMGNTCDLIGKVITIRKKIITDIDIVITAKYPTPFYGESFPIKWQNAHWNRIQILGKSLILTALYE